MNQRQRFIRKIVYACVIAALLLPAVVAQPAGKRPRPTAARLAKCAPNTTSARPQLGEIDPASETIKLATLGMRGVAANLLWQKANDYRKTEDWVNLSATLEQIAKLQPNFVSVWIFQGWNLSYNISVEFDDYHDRYYWVIQRHRLPEGRHAVQHRTSRGCSRRSATRSRKRSAAPTSTCSFANCSARTTTSTATGPRHSATTGWWVASGCSRPSDAVDRRRAAAGRTAAVVLFASSDVPDQLRRGTRRRRHFRRSGQERLDQGRRSLGRVFQPRPARPAEHAHAARPKRKPTTRNRGRPRPSSPS